jgi:hypothetical protein
VHVAAHFQEIKTAKKKHELENPLIPETAKKKHELENPLIPEKDVKQTKKTENEYKATIVKKVTFDLPHTSFLRKLHPQRPANTQAFGKKVADQLDTSRTWLACKAQHSLYTRVQFLIKLSKIFATGAESSMCT